MATEAEIKSAIMEAGDGYALDMFEAIKRKASVDADYAEVFALWIRRGSTVLLRDELCWPFRNGSIVEYYRPKLPLPFQNMWEAIDSARAKSA